MIFNPNIPVLSIVLFALSALGVLFLIIVYGRKLRVVRRRRSQCDAASPEQAEAMPRTSVVVYSPGDAEILSRTLPAILKQDFPGFFEVIVVDDGAFADTDTLVKHHRRSFPNLYLTFAPAGSRVLSRKKLAITLGVKAAKGDIVVVTDSTTMVPSDQWLKRMVAPFADPAVEVVLALNRHALPHGRWPSRTIAVFDAACDQVAWLSSAIESKPYRGCGSNIAYRRDLFFKNKGFSQALNLRNGDDDLFVNEIATHANTCVELSAATIGEEGYPKSAHREMRNSRLSHAFTGRYLSRSSRRVLAAGHWMLWLSPICAVGAAVIAGLTNIFGWILAAVIIIAETVSIILMWRCTLAALGYPKLTMSVPFVAPFHPLRNIIVNLRCTDRNLANFTWQ